MTKSIEDYPELVKFKRECKWDAVTIHKNEYYAYGEQDVEEKLLEMQERINELEKYNLGLAQESHQKSERISELESQVEFKVNECITLAKACQRWKESALNKESK